MIRLVLTSIAGLAAIALIWSVGDGWQALRTVHVSRIPLYLGLVLFIVTLHAWRWRLVLHRVAATAPPLGELVRLWLGARAVGSLIPSGTLAGEPLRAALLRAGGIASGRAAGAVALDRSLELAGNMIAGPACVGTALILGAGSLLGAAAATGVALAGLAVLAFVYVRAARGRPALRSLVPTPFRDDGRLAVAARETDAALASLVTEHPGMIPSGLAISLFIEALHLVELTALLAIFGLVLPLPLLLLCSVGIGVARSVPVTAALGSLEATQVGLLTASGHSLAFGLSVGLVLRLAETAWILVGLACLVAAGVSPGLAIQSDRG